MFSEAWTGSSDLEEREGRLEKTWPLLTSSAQRWHLPLMLIVHWWEHVTWLQVDERGLWEEEWVWVNYQFTLRSLEHKGLHPCNHLPIADNCHLVFSFAFRDIEVGGSFHMLLPGSYPSWWAPLSSQKLWQDMRDHLGEGVRTCFRTHMCVTHVPTPAPSLMLAYFPRYRAKL